jgi:DNA-binding MarR family transcriptional regulator
MAKKIRAMEYAALAEIRYRIRQFLRGSDAAALECGLEPQQYQLLLALHAFPDPTEASIRAISERLYLKHHSTVGLVDRLEARGYVKRLPGKRDQRQVIVALRPQGMHALERVVSQRLHELRESGPDLIRALTSVLRSAEKTASKSKSPQK